jgi:chromosome segregation ATPase
MKLPDYTNIPVSDITIQGANEGKIIDVMGAMIRVAKVQDGAYIDAFIEINNTLLSQGLLLSEISKTIQALREQIGELRTEAWEMKTQISEITKRVSETQKDIQRIEKDVDILKRHDSLFNHVVRIGIGIGSGILAFLGIHHFWLSK